MAPLPPLLLPLVLCFARAAEGASDTRSMYRLFMEATELATVKQHVRSTMEEISAQKRDVEGHRELLRGREGALRELRIRLEKLRGMERCVCVAVRM